MKVMSHHGIKIIVFCINLIDREDRYQHALSQFSKTQLDVNFLRVSRHHLGGRYGCFDSHIQCITNAYNSNVDYVMIFEDDICFMDNYKQKIQSIWDFLLSDRAKQNNGLIYTQRRAGVLNLVKKIDSLSYYGQMYGGTCYIANKVSMKKIIENYHTSINNCQIDIFYFNLFSSTCIILIDPLCGVAPFDSDNDSWASDQTTWYSKLLANFGQFLTKYTSFGEDIGYDNNLQNQLDKFNPERKTLWCRNIFPIVSYYKY